jgi:pyrroline-5-carboxylate reductase
VASVGFVGAGNMASALAKGLKVPAIFTDTGSGSAARLALEVNGHVSSNSEIGDHVDLLFLTHKPQQLIEVASEVLAGGNSRLKIVVSALARTSVATVASAYPGMKVARIAPNINTEIGLGSTLLAADADDKDGLLEVRTLLIGTGSVHEIPESLFEQAAAVACTGPAYWALMMEAEVDAAIRYGLPKGIAERLVVETMAGTAELLRHNAYDTLAVRRAVSSPGGSTSRGLGALEKNGIRSAMSSAFEEYFKTER